MMVPRASTLLALQSNIWLALEKIKSCDIDKATKRLFQTHGVGIGDVDQQSPELAVAHGLFDLLVHLQMILRLQQVYVQSWTYAHIPVSESQDPLDESDQCYLLSPILLHEMLRLLVEFLLHSAALADTNIYRQVVRTVHAGIRIAHLHPHRTESSAELIKIPGSIDKILQDPRLSDEALSEERIELIACTELIKRAPHAQRSEKPWLPDITMQLYPLDNSAIVEKVEEVMMEYQNEWLDSYWTTYDILSGVSGAILQHGAHKDTSQCNFDALLTKIVEKLSNQHDLVTGKTLDPQVGLSLQKLSSHAVSLRDQVLGQQARPVSASEFAQTPEQERLELKSLETFRAWLMTRQDIAGQGPGGVNRDGLDAYELEWSLPTPESVGTPRHPELTPPILGGKTGFQTKYTLPPLSPGEGSFAHVSRAQTAASVASKAAIVPGKAMEAAAQGAQKRRRRVRRGISSWFRRFSCF